MKDTLKILTAVGALAMVSQLAQASQDLIFSTRPITASEYEAIDKAIDGDLETVENLSNQVFFAWADIQDRPGRAVITTDEKTLALVSPATVYKLSRLNNVKVNPALIPSGQVVIAIGVKSPKETRDKAAAIKKVMNELAVSSRVLIVERALLRQASRQNLSVEALSNWIEKEDRILSQIFDIRRDNRNNTIGVGSAGAELERSFAAADQFHLRRVMALLDLRARAQK